MSDCQVRITDFGLSRSTKHPPFKDGGTTKSGATDMHSTGGITRAEVGLRKCQVSYGVLIQTRRTCHPCILDAAVRFSFSLGMPSANCNASSQHSNRMRFGLSCWRLLPSDKPQRLGFLTHVPDNTQERAREQNERPEPTQPELIIFRSSQNCSGTMPVDLDPLAALR